MEPPGPPDTNDWITGDAAMAARTLLWIAIGATLLSGCGGGGGSSGGGGNNASGNPPPPTFNFKTASVVIGQADFTSSSPNQGGTTAANTINNPYGSPAYDNGVLYLPDGGNNRILGFNALPTINNATADFVIGQTGDTQNTSGTSASAVDSPQSPSISDGQLFITDYFNNRALVYNPVPTTGPVSASLALGQADLTSNAEACSQTGMIAPESLSAAAGKLVVADTDNSRVLIWNDNSSLSNGSPADVVLGQNSFTNCTDNDDDQNGSPDAQPSNRTLAFPTGVWTDGNKLVVLDSDNNRALIWNSFPTTHFTPADIVLGQETFQNNTANDDNQDGVPEAKATARTLNFPYDGVDSDGTRLVITDSDNHRVLIWNQFPQVSFDPADEVIGQTDFFNNLPNDDDQDGLPDTQPSNRTLNEPTGVALIDSQTLIVGDRQNNRFLVFRK